MVDRAGLSVNVGTQVSFVFGCNTLVTFVIETVLMVVVVDIAGFSVDVHQVRTQVSRVNVQTSMKGLDVDVSASFEDEFIFLCCESFI